MNNTRIKLEVCVDTCVGLEAAIAGGADRIELCAALALGGLTPSPGFMTLAAKSPVPVYAMVRPRIGDFVYSETEIGVMRRDIDAARAAGLAGVVLGANIRTGAMDEVALRTLSAHAFGLGTTLHRAIDLVPDILDAVDIAAEFKFERILSSGGRKTAMEGIDTLSAMIEHAGSRISIMPGSGVSYRSVERLISRLEIHEVHGSCSIDVSELDAKVLAFGFAPANSRQTSSAEVAALRRVLDQKMPFSKSSSTM
jgi:copper homeostasis protein